MPNLFGRPLYSYLPMGGLLYELDKPMNERRIWKVFSYVAYSVIGLSFALGSFVITLQQYKQTGTLNPFEQNRILEEREIKKTQIEERKDSLYQKIFGPGGYADSNFDKKINSDEMLNAYKKVKWDDIPIKEPTLEELEKLIKVYEEE